MEAQGDGAAHTIEVNSHKRAAQTSPRGRKICEGAVCGFSDGRGATEDAEERARSMKKLWVAVVLCVVFMSVEVGGGIKANSLAILTDAAHLLSDVAAFAISLFSLWASGWEATPRQSYGFFRIEILGALVSIQLIWLLTGILVYEAIARIVRHDPRQVDGSLMFAVSAFGLVVNVLMALLLGHDHGGHHAHRHANDDVTFSTDHPDHHHHYNGQDGTDPLLQRKEKNINVQGAYVHVVGDSVQSVGVMVGGGVIWWRPEWKAVDLVCTVLFSAVVMGTTIRMLRSIVEVLMESTPREVDATRLERGLCQMPEVVAVHELHIWAITVGKVLLACHVTVGPAADADMVLDKVVEYIRTEYNISHVTIQIERQEVIPFFSSVPPSMEAPTLLPARVMMPPPPTPLLLSSCSCEQLLFWAACRPTRWCVKEESISLSSLSTCRPLELSLLLVAAAMAAAMNGGRRGKGLNGDGVEY